jgi:hypothetical protein
MDMSGGHKNPYSNWVIAVFAAAATMKSKKKARVTTSP